MANKKRMLRSWYLGSLVWFAVVAAFSWSAIANPDVPEQGLVYTADGTPKVVLKDSNEFRAAEEDVKRGRMRKVTVQGLPDVTVFADQSASDDHLRTRSRELQTTALEARRSAVREARREATKRSALFAFVPPAGTLFAGIAITFGLSRTRLGGKESQA